MADGDDQQPSQRPEAPVLTLDTNIDPEPFLALPAHARNDDSIDSNSETYSPVSSRPSSVVSVRSSWNNVRHPYGAPSIHSRVDISDALRPDPGTESYFNVFDNKFSFSPGHLAKLFNPKSLAAFHALGGLRGLERGLRTDRQHGLSIDETGLAGTIGFEEAVNPTTAIFPSSHPQLPTDGVGTNYQPFHDRKRVFGTNIWPPRKQISLLRCAYLVIADPVLLTLTVLTTIALAFDLWQQPRADSHLSTWKECSALLGLILFGVLLDVFWGLKKDHERTRSQTSVDRQGQVRVVRSGRLIVIEQTDVLVGDLVVLRPGDPVLADGILVQGKRLTFDESMATGESDFIPKATADEVTAAIENGANLRRMDPMILSGSRVVDGSGSFLVTCVGIHSCLGKTIMSLERAATLPKSEYRSRRFFSGPVSIGGIVAIAGLFIGLLIKFCVLQVPSQKSHIDKGRSFLDIGILLAALANTLLPTAALAIINLATFRLSYEMSRAGWRPMSTVNPLEVLGTVTCIHLDMDSLLRQDRAEVKALWGAGRLWISGEPGTTEKSEQAWEKPPWITKYLADLLATAIVSTSLWGQYRYPGQYDERESVDGSENRDGRPLLKFAYDQLDFLSPKASTERDVLDYLPSNIKQGRFISAAVLEIPDGGKRLYLKGPHAAVLRNCRMLASEGQGCLSLNEERRANLEESVGQLYDRSMQVIAVAYHDFTGSLDLAKLDGLLDFVYIGALGIETPFCQDTKEVVTQSQTAGVLLRLVTSEPLRLALTIAHRCGILTETRVGVRATDFNSLSNYDQEDMLPRLSVIAEVNWHSGPQHPDAAAHLTPCINRMKEIVAWIGLNVSRHGYSVHVTYEPDPLMEDLCAFTATDGSVQSVLSMVRWSRWLLRITPRLARHSLISIIPPVTVAFISALTAPGTQSVLRPLQLFWLYIILNVWIAMALVIEKPRSDVLKTMGPPSSTPLLTGTSWTLIIGQVLFHILVTLVLLFGVSRLLGYADTQSEKAGALVFSTLAWLQIFSTLHCRLPDGRLNIFLHLGRKSIFLGIYMIAIFAQVVVCLFGHGVFLQSTLGWKEWTISVLAGLSSIPAGLAIRRLPNQIPLAVSTWFLDTQKFNADSNIGPTGSDNVDSSKRFAGKYGIRRWLRYRYGSLRLLYDPVAFWTR
ncbi:hypothetical protein F4778DRAFT_468684 [Xylariomycetidae sp. FL2044]|nr:hypothetical protein F4778DRAFT_468684 [Xylariomycetidae sp. FL2044]